MRECGFATGDGCFPPTLTGSAVAMTEWGLVYTGGSVLVRMRKTAEGRPHLAVGADRERMLALLSVAFRRAVAASDVIPHVETAAEHWHRGEKALANLRLVFAGLSGRSDPTAGDRVALAAHLLDQGWPPAALFEELGFGSGTADLAKYNPYHVPAGHGDRSGEFDFRPEARRHRTARLSSRPATTRRTSGNASFPEKRRRRKTWSTAIRSRLRPEFPSWGAKAAPPAP